MNTKNKFTLFFSAVAISLSGVAQAQILITDFEQTDTAASGFSITVAAVDNDWLFSFSNTGDLDGLGNGDDTLTFDLRSSAFEGSTFTPADGGDPAFVTLGSAFDYSEGGTLSSPGNQHFGPNADIDNGESFQLSIENISYTSGHDSSDTAIFDGFSSGNLFGGSSSSTYYFGTTSVESSVGGTFSGKSYQVLTVTSTVNNSRFRDLAFGFSVVPEAGSFALMAGCFGLGLVMLRRRRA